VRGVLADYFWKNWKARREPMAFLLYDSPPVLPLGAPVFIHPTRISDFCSFRGSQFIAGYKPMADATSDFPSARESGLVPGRDD
jgi:hypothetical protein